MNLQLPAEETTKHDISVRRLGENDLSTADHIMRVAFGTFLGLREPASFMGDASYVQTRWKAKPDAAFAAEINNELVGSNFATNWGQLRFFRAVDHPPRSMGQRRRQTVDATRGGMFRQMANEARRSVHFRT
jgi:hypothetical protein